VRAQVSLGADLFKWPTPAIYSTCAAAVSFSPNSNGVFAAAGAAGVRPQLLVSALDVAGGGVEDCSITVYYRACGNVHAATAVSDSAGYAVFSGWTGDAAAGCTGRQNATLVASCPHLVTISTCYGRDIRVPNFLTVYVYDTAVPPPPQLVPQLSFSVQPAATAAINVTLPVAVLASAPPGSGGVASSGASTSPWFLDAVDMSLVPLVRDMDVAAATAWAMYFSRNADAWSRLMSGAQTTLAAMAADASHRCTSRTRVHRNCNCDI
jgi:hypothetical protein